jgi:hypothetical protein
MMNGGVIMGMVNSDSQKRDANTSVRTRRKASGKATRSEIDVAREPRIKVFFVTLSKWGHRYVGKGSATVKAEPNPLVKRCTIGTNKKPITKRSGGSKSRILGNRATTLFT